MREDMVKTNYKIAIALVAGAAIGGAAIQGLHAQAKPKAYVITEVEIINQEAFKEFVPKVAEANKIAGGQYLARGEKITALDGQPPKRVTLQVYESVEKAQASRTTEAWKAIAPLRAKATKTRSYIVEALAN
jgi:uncharacterized protein (DUF1330 family)